MLTDQYKSAWVAISQKMLTRDALKNDVFFSSIFTMDETWTFLTPNETPICAMQAHCHRKEFRVTASDEKVILAMFWDSEA